MISKLQNLRKETGLEVVDRINVLYAGNDKLGAVIAKRKDYIASEVLAVSFEEGEGDSAKEVTINGEKIRFTVTKA